LGQFALKKWPFFQGKKRRPILNNSGSIFGQFIQKNGHFLGKKHGGQFGTFFGQFIFKNGHFFKAKKGGDF